MPNCWRCIELFDVEPNDERPMVYHKCKDGSMAGHINPNLVEKEKLWVAQRMKESKPSRKPTWLDFGRD